MPHSSVWGSTPIITIFEARKIRLVAFVGAATTAGILVISFLL